MSVSTKKRLQYDWNWLGIISVVIFITLFVGGRTIHKSLYSSIDYLDYRIYQQEKRVFSNPTKIIASNKNVVIFYGECGYAAFYSLDGIFEYGIQVDNSDTGVGNIAFIGEICYIISQNNTVYCFLDSTLIESFQCMIDSNMERCESIDQQMGSSYTLSCRSSNYTYSLLFNKGIVEKKDEHGISSTLIKLHNYETPLYIIGIGCFCFLEIEHIYTILKRRRWKRLRTISEGATKDGSKWQQSIRNTTEESSNK